MVRVDLWRGEVETSRYHGSNISGSFKTNCGPSSMTEKKKTKTKTKEKLRCVTFLFPFFFPSFDNANGRLGQENIVESQKFCNHGNVTSHFSSLLPCCLFARSIELFVSYNQCYRCYG